jgi:hypothetical protein
MPPFFVVQNLFLEVLSMSENPLLPLPYHSLLPDYDILDEAIGIVEAATSGLTEPGRWGHWYRGKDPAKRAIVAAAQAERRKRREENKKLAWLMNPWSPEAFCGPRRTKRSLNYLRWKFCQTEDR